MSLFKWSTPKRRSVDRILPIIPNEIYLDIFEHIAPSTVNLTQEQIRIFTNLSRVCRFFANVCLARIFEFVVFSGSIFRTPTVFRNDTVYKTSRESVLCTQIAAKQPLALSLAKKVRVCHFTNWELDDNFGFWAVQLFAKKYIAGMAHMKNLRQLQFSNCFLDAEHWGAIATLQSLQDLSFDRCQFLQGLKSEKRVKLKVSRLQVTTTGAGHRQPFAAIDAGYLRTLVVDFVDLDHVDWFPQSVLTELSIHPGQRSCLANDDAYIEQVHAMLMQAPQSVEALWLPLGVEAGSAQGVIRSMFDGPAWKNLHLLRSLTLKVLSQEPDNNNIPAVLSLVVDGIGLLTGLQSLTLESYQIGWQIAPTEVRRILHDKLGPGSSLGYVDIYGRILHLVDGEWSEVSCSTA